MALSKYLGLHMEPAARQRGIILKALDHLARNGNLRALCMQPGVINPRAAMTAAGLAPPFWLTRAAADTIAGATAQDGARGAGLKQRAGFAPAPLSQAVSAARRSAGRPTPVASNPPSTASTCPETKLALSEHRKTMASAISRASP